MLIVITQERYHFTVITDHASLKWLHNLKNSTGCLARLSLALSEYDFAIVHRKGSSNHDPDALSRMYESSKEQIHIIQIPNSSWYVRRFMAVKSYPEKCSTWKIIDDKFYHFRHDSVISSLVQDLTLEN